MRVPVVASRVSSLPEVVGDAAIAVDPLDEDALAQAILDVVEDAELAARLRRRGLERAAGFTWARTVERTAGAYRAMLAGA